MAVELVLAISWAGTRGFLDRWSVPEWFVAVGTVGLAFVTYRLVRRVKAQVGVEKEQLVAATRPLVVPLQGDNFPPSAHQIRGPHVLVQNVGTGPALNLRGSLYWTGGAGGASSLHPLVLAAGAQEYAKVLGEGVEVNWGNAVGFLRYHDLGGIEWQTHFRFPRDAQANISVEVLAVGPTSEFGEPGYNAEEGWTNRPKGVALLEV